jgi:hypothetical protein
MVLRHWMILGKGNVVLCGVMLQLVSKASLDGTPGRAWHERLRRKLTIDDVVCKILAGFLASWSLGAREPVPGLPCAWVKAQSNS